MHKNRIEALAKPKKWRDVVSIMERTLPEPVSKAAIGCQLEKTSRIWNLSKPKLRQPNPLLHQNIKTTYSVNWTPNKYDHTSNRIIELAQPKQQLKFHPQCNKVEPRKSYLRPYEKQTAWLKINAVPKTIFKPPLVLKKYTKLTEAEIEEFIDRLSAIPKSRRYTILKKEPKPKIKKLPDKMIESINRLSEPRKLASEMRLNIEYNPFEIPLRVLRHKPSKRIGELAEPKVYETSAIKDAIRENPFEVSKSSLKYKATKLIKKLAQPRRYDN
ncbi:Testicular haploid expressed repeat [Cinara cedri]|uniref:Testicular haploid expressed repeat n=1 Tax=Cinara cedri TaxID=506608 RepID=A0A5E4M5T8_9HEMI|nr:Testicular haploid expressed repeat [Cinara cedri]